MQQCLQDVSGEAVILSCSVSGPVQGFTAACAPLQDEFQLSVGSGKPFGSMNMVSKSSALLSCWQLSPRPAASTCRACCSLCRCAPSICQSVCGSLHAVLLLQDEFLQTVWDREPSLLSLGGHGGRAGAVEAGAKAAAQLQLRWQLQPP